MNELSTSSAYNDEKLERDEEKKDGFWHPKSVSYKCMIFILITATATASYYCSAATPTLQDRFEENLNVTTTQFSLFNSFKYWPSVFICLMSGILIDKIFGIRLATIIFVLVQSIGQLVFSLGATINVYWVMMVGKFLFGAGDESVAIVLTSFPVIWFEKKELNTVFGFQIAFFRLMSTANYWTMEPIYQQVESVESFGKRYAVGVTLFIASITCIFSMLCAIILSIMDKRAEKILSRRSQNDQNVQMSYIKSLKLNFWFICIICSTFYIGFYTYISLAKVFIEQKFHSSPDESNRINSLAFTLPIIASPLCGLIVDRTGKLLLWIVLGLLSILISLLLLAFTDVTPQVGTILMGLGYSICSVLVWSAAAMIIPDEHLGAAYGIMNSLKNLGLSVFSMVAGVIVDHSGYFALQLYLMGFITIGTISTIILFIRAGNLFEAKSKADEVK